MLPSLILNLAVARAYVVKGYVSNFQSVDIGTTSVHIQDLTSGEVAVEPLSSMGNFTFRDLSDGNYTLYLASSTLSDLSNYRLEIENGALQVQRVPHGSVIEEPVGYPINLRATRLPERKPEPKPRLSAIYKDRTVLMAAVGLLLLNILPKTWQSLDIEELKALEGQQGLQNAFSAAHKVAMGDQNKST